MRETIIPSGRRSGIQLIPSGISGMLAYMAKKALLSRLQKLVRGRLVLNEGTTTAVFGETGDNEKLKATLFVHDHRFYTDIAHNSSESSS
jgi:hypothetical protein